MEVSPAVCRLSGFYRDCACASSFLRYADNRFILLLEKGPDTSANDLARALNAEGLIDGSGQQTKQSVFLEFLDRDARRLLEESWLQSRQGQRGGKPSKHTNACCRNSARTGAGQTAGPGTPSRCCMSSKDKSLQEYMQKVEQSLLKNNNCTIQEAKRLMTLYDADFPELMKQFPDPKVASLAMVMGY